MENGGILKRTFATMPKKHARNTLLMQLCTSSLASPCWPSTMLKPFNARSDCLKNQIRVPRAMWTAYCCLASDGTVVGRYAVVANNRKAKKAIQVTELSVEKLQEFIRKDVEAVGGKAAAVQLFPGKPKCASTTNEDSGEETGSSKKIKPNPTIAPATPTTLYCSEQP